MKHATPILWGNGGGFGTLASRAWPLFPLFVAVFVAALHPSCLAADTNSPAHIDFAARARDAYERARHQYDANPTNAAAAIDFARTCFDWADLVKTDRERAAIAKEGIAACEDALKRDARSAPAHYYLAMDYGQLARTETLGALKLVREMETEYKAVVDLDEDYDYAGADRGLGLLYRDAPSWGSIGSRSKARLHLQRAVDLAPDYPENLLNLAETYLKWADREAARNELDALDKIWSAARAKFTGDAWALSWQDWEARLAEARQRLGKLSRPPRSGHPL